MALCLAVLMLGAEKHRSTPFAPIGVGLTLFACHLFALGYTGAAMNTARAFGPAVVSGFSSSVFSGKDVGKHWVYWVGPTIGAIAASGVYVLLKRIHYWKLSPGQDAVHQPASPDPSPTEEYVERAERGELGGDNGDGQSEGPAMGEKRGRS
jgi:aquaporin related protein